MFYLLGSGLASLIGAILTDLVGFYNGQRISAALILAAAVLWFFFLPETRETAPVFREEKALLIKIDPLPWKVIAPAAFIIFTTRFIDRGLLAATVPLWINKIFGNGLSILTIVIPIATLTGIYNAFKILPGIGSAPALGALSDRLGKRWVVIAGALLVGAIGIWIMSLPLIAIAWIGALIVPVIGAGVETLVPAIIGDHTSRAINGRVLGIIYIFADLDSTLGPITGLGLLDASPHVIGRALSCLCTVHPCRGGCRLFILAEEVKTGFSGGIKGLSVVIQPPKSVKEHNTGFSLPSQQVLFQTTSSSFPLLHFFRL